MKRIIGILSLFTLLSAFPLRAQLEGAVTVEGEFDPLVIETERLGEYPQAYRFELPPLTLSYDSEGKATNFSPSLLAMGVTGWNTRRLSAAPRGYLDLRVGSFLNSRLDAGVWIVRDSVNTLSADLNYRSTSLYKTHGVPDTYSAPVRRRLYDGTLGLNYSRLLGDEGLFASRIAYRLGYFNYYGSVTPALPEITAPDVPTQTLNQVNFKVGYTSSPSLLYGWHAGGAVEYTAYRAFIYPDYAAGEKGKGDRETRLLLEGGYTVPIGEYGGVALDADADLLFYAERRLLLPGFEGDWRKDYGVVSLTPAYRMQKGGVSLQAGLDLDIAFSAMGMDRAKDFGTLHVAPDIKFAYRTHSFGLTMQATGGATPVTLAGMEEFDRYQLPVLMSTCPVYTPVDASIGLSFGPYSGFSADLEFRYAVAKGIPLGGWYQVLLGTYEGAFNSLKYYGEPEMSLVAPYGARTSLHGLGLGIDLRYLLEGIVEASVKGSYTPQRGRFGIFNGYDRPRCVLDAEVKVYPVRRLSVELGYGLRAIRAIYGMDQVGANEVQLVSMRLPNVSDLRAKITYRLFDTFDVYALTENLLNRRVDILPGLQCNGIAVSGGIYWEF